eukprot:396067_1
MANLALYAMYLHLSLELSMNHSTRMKFVTTAITLLVIYVIVVNALVALFMVFQDWKFMLAFHIVNAMSFLAVGVSAGYAYIRRNAVLGDSAAPAAARSHDLLWLVGTL